MTGSADSKKYIVATDRPEPLITPGELQPISWGVSPLMGEDAFYLRWNGSVAYHSRSHILLRTFVCPGCARLLATETTMENEPHLQNTLTTG
jgi:hypothetical protein